MISDSESVDGTRQHYDVMQWFEASRKKREDAGLEGLNKECAIVLFIELKLLWSLFYQNRPVNISRKSF